MKNTIRTLVALLICLATVLCLASCEEKGKYVELTEDNKEAKLTELADKIADDAVVGTETEDGNTVTREIGAILSVALKADITVNDVAIKATASEKMTVASKAIYEKLLLEKEVTDSNLNAKVESKFSLSTKASDAALEALLKEEAMEDIGGIAQFLANKKGSFESAVTLVDGILYVESENSFDKIDLFSGKVAMNFNKLVDLENEEDEGEGEGEGGGEGAKDPVDFGTYTMDYVDTLVDVLDSANVAGSQLGLSAVISAVESAGFKISVDTDKMFIKVEAGEDLVNNLKKEIEEDEDNAVTTLDIKKCEAIFKFNKNGNLVSADVNVNAKVDVTIDGLHVTGSVELEAELDTGSIPEIKAPDIKKFTDITPIIVNFASFDYDD